MSKRTQELLLRDIIESAEKVINYTNNITFEQFALSSITIDAVIRNIEIIGEAANRLPDEFKDNYPQINWHKIRRLRNRVVHDYFGIDHLVCKRKLSARTYPRDFCSSLKYTSSYLLT